MTGPYQSGNLSVPYVGSYHDLVEISIEHRVDACIYVRACKYNLYVLDSSYGS